MSIRQYLEYRERLPDPRGSLSQSLASRAIAAANREVEKTKNDESKKRGSYTR